MGRQSALAAVFGGNKKGSSRCPEPVNPTGFVLERAMRFELTTLTLARLCSTPELRPRSVPSGCPFGERWFTEAAGGLQEENARRREKIFQRAGIAVKMGLRGNRGGRPCLMPHASCLMPHAHASCLPPPASRLPPHTTHLMAHTSRLTPHASRLMHHAVRLTPSASQLPRPASHFPPHAFHFPPPGGPTGETGRESADCGMGTRKSVRAILAESGLDAG